jgi:amino acid transporter
MVEILTLAKLVPLLGLVCVGIFFVRLDNLRLDGVPTAGEFGAATLVLFFAFAGSESAVTPSGEIRDPARTIPRGLLLGILGIASLFIAIQIVAQGVLGASLPEHSAAPLAATAERLIGPSGIVILLAAAAISMLGALGGDLLATPRALFASARDGILPRRLASIHPRFHTPFLAIGLYAALGFVLAASGLYETLAILSSMAILLVYLATAAATIELRRRDVRATPAVFRLIGGPLIPLVAAAVIVWLLSQARREEWLSIAVLVAVAAAVYALRRTSRRLGRQPD